MFPEPTPEMLKKIANVVSTINEAYSVQTPSEDDLLAFARETLQDILKLLEEKGLQYTNGDALVNYRECSGFLDMSQRLYLMALATKHWHVLALNARGESRSTHELEQRAKDIINYMIIYLFILSQEEL